MVSPGYDFQLGDIWAVNEAPVTLPGDKEQQQAMIDFVRGTPLENAAWQWAFGFGITTIPIQEMAKFVSLQAYTSAVFAKRNPNLQTLVRIGFAWAPKNTDNLPKAHFVAGARSTSSTGFRRRSAPPSLRRGSSPTERAGAVGATVFAGFRAPS
jgi:hypothetical protein